MAFIPFGTWRPDTAGVNAREQSGAIILQNAKNVLPNELGYTLLRQLAEDSDFELPDQCHGLFYARTSSGSFVIFAATRTQIFRYVPGTGWVDYTRASGNDSFTKVLLHMNGVDAATTFTDSNLGGSAHTWTARGNAQIDTADSKFGGASGLFDGTGDWVDTPDHADYTLGTSDFTIELWFKCNVAGGSIEHIAGQGDSGFVAATTTFNLRRSAANVIEARLSDGSVYTTVTGTTQYTNAVNTGWHHLALVRTGNVLMLFLDGVQEGGNTAFTGTVPDATNLLSVGKQGEVGGNEWTGWLDEFRMSVGVARWTADFDPPTNAYGNGTVYGCLEDDYWTGTQFGSLLILGQISDNPQSLDIDGSTTQFADLSGSPPKARYWVTVGQFVVAGCLATDNRAVHNSAIGSAVGWTIGTNLSDSQTLYDGGRVTGLADGGANGSFAYVTQEKSLRRMVFQSGSQTAFRFEQITKACGNALGFGLIQAGNGIFFADDAGFYFYGPEGLDPIGTGAFNEWFKTNGDTQRLFNVQGFIDPFGPRVLWAFFSSTGSTNFDRLLIYDWRFRKATYSDASAQFWATMATPAVSLESLDALFPSIDAMSASLDSSQFGGGRPLLGAINAAGHMSFTSGTPQDALLLTAPMQVNPSGRANVGAVEPTGNWGDATLAVRVGRRENMKTAASYTAALAPSTNTGVARLRASGRFHEIELGVTQSTGVLWSLAQGINLTAGPDGEQ